MQRDWELIRAILAKVEALPDTRSRLFARSLNDWPEDGVNYHFWLLVESGLVEGKCTAPPGGNAGTTCFLTTLTWTGHEFLDTVRSDTAWNRIRQQLAEKALELSFEAIVAAGRAALRMIG